MDAQLKRGVVEMCLLSCVAKQDMYGYDIVRSLQEFVPDTSESSVYATLRRLQWEKALEQYVGAVSGGPPRKYYRITPLGQELLARRKEDWVALLKMVQHFCPDINTDLFE